MRDDITNVMSSLIGWAHAQNDPWHMTQQAPQQCHQAESTDPTGWLPGNTALQAGHRTDSGSGKPWGCYWIPLVLKIGDPLFTLVSSCVKCCQVLHDSGCEAGEHHTDDDLRCRQLHIPLNLCKISNYCEPCISSSLSATSDMPMLYQ